MSTSTEEPADPGRFIRALSVFTLLLAGGAIYPVFRPVVGLAAAETSPADSYVASIWTILYLAWLLVLGTRGQRGQLVGHLRRPPLALLLVGALALLSYTYSTAPDVTLKRALAVAGTAATAYAMVRVLGLPHMLDCLRTSLIIGAVLSLASLLVLRGYAHQVTIPGLRGVYAQKNILGRLMALGALEGILRYGQAGRRFDRLTISLFLATLVLSLSSTGILVFAGSLILLWALRQAQRQNLAGVLALQAILLISILAAAFSSSVTLLGPLIGKDATLSNRTEIWSRVIRAIMQHPLQGWGYGAFFRPGGPSDQISLELEDYAHQIVHAHNGFLDVWLNLGLIGLIFASILLLRPLILGFSRGNILAGGLAGFFLLYNITEETLVAQNTLYFVVIAAVYVSTFVGPASPARRKGPISELQRGGITPYSLSR